MSRIIEMADERGEFFTDVDGYVYYWPSNKPEHAGHLSAHQLREIADELDCRNAAWELDINNYFAGKP